MKFLIMLTGTQADYDAMNGNPSEGHPSWSQDEIKTMFQHMGALNDDLSERGELVDANGLPEPKQARLVTAAADGSPVISDGPYGETKEVLAGYWVVDVENIDRATEIAARAHACPVPAGTPNPPVIVRQIDQGDTGAEM